MQILYIGRELAFLHQKTQKENIMAKNTLAMVAVLGMTAALSAETAPVAAAAVAAPVAAAAAVAAPTAPMGPKETEFMNKLDAAHQASFKAMSQECRQTAMMMNQKGCQGQNGCKAKDANVACEMAAKKMADKRAAQ